MSLGGSQNEEVYTQVNIDLFSKFHAVLSRLKNQTNLTGNEIIELLEKGQDDFLPASIFSERKLGILEIIVKYLVEERGLSLNKIAKALQRDNRTVWSSYSNAKKKCPKRLSVVVSDYMVPLAIFRDRRHGVLEALVVYLRDTFNMRYSEIGQLLARDQRTIWTVYRRARAK